MSDNARTGRRLRLVDPDVPVEPSPFDVPACRPAASVSGPAPRPLPQPPSPDVDWPSVDWLAHYTVCPDGRRCRHRFEFPGWWLGMRNRGLPLHEDADQALQMAVGMVNGYKGHPALQPEPLLFTQKAVLDSLSLAPSPVGYSWMRITLAVVAGIARWVHSTGQPLTREHVFSEEVRYRYNQTCTQHSEGTRNLNWLRLEMVADFLNGVTPSRVLRKPTITQEAPVEPLTRTEEADLWMWASGVRPASRRHRVTAVLALGLGCGLSGGETIRANVDHVVRDADGVHIEVLSKRNGTVRLVTCRVEWEERLWTIAEATPAGHYLTTPWRDTPSPTNAAAESMRRAAKKNPPMLFNSTRLRNTWLCRHLEAGTPLKVLMEAADMKEANHLHNLLALLPANDPQQVKQILRTSIENAADHE